MKQGVFRKLTAAWAILGPLNWSVQWFSSKGEIACVDDVGRSVFNDLLFRRRECLFFAFDLLFVNGEDVRAFPLIGGKHD
jgi:hypothetical protein